MKKILSLGAIMLLLGLAIAPSIHIDIAKASATEEALIDFTIDVCGINGIKPQTFKLTEQQFNDVLKLFDNIKTQLEKIRTTDEAIPIYKEAVIELDKFGLFPDGMIVQEIQNLVTGKNQNIFQKKIYTKLFNKDHILLNELIDERIANLFCLVFAYPNNAYFYIAQLNLLLFIFLYILDEFNLFIPVIILLQEISRWLSENNPFLFSSFVLILGKAVGEHNPSVISLGLLGLDHKSLSNGGMSMLGFTGLKIQYDLHDQYEYQKGFLLGYTPILLDGILF
jgi:hypothetical protein